MRQIVVTVRQVSGHSKICNLQNQHQKNCLCNDLISIMPCISSCHPLGCSWQQGLCVQSSSWTGTPYLRQSDDSILATVYTGSDAGTMSPGLEYCIKSVVNEITLVHTLYQVSIENF